MQAITAIKLNKIALDGIAINQSCMRFPLEEIYKHLANKHQRVYPCLQSCRCFYRGPRLCNNGPITVSTLAEKQKVLGKNTMR